MLHPAEERRQCGDGPVQLADDFPAIGFRDFANALGPLARGLGRLSVLLLLLSHGLRLGHPPLGVTVHVALLHLVGIQDAGRAMIRAQDS